jgi:hypothetical protein
MANKYSHIHKYLRDKLGKLIIYKCALPGCPHYIRQNLVVGKVSLCWVCNKEFVMTRAMAKLKKPHCPDCRIAHNAKPVQPKNEAASLTDNFLNNILPGVVEKQ